MTGIHGKLPSYGDFLRRELPLAFVGPWDHSLQAGMQALMAQWGDSFESRWAAGPAWRFVLAPGICGNAGVAGVLMPSADSVGRAYPLTLAALLPAGSGPPGDDWFEALERAGRTALGRRCAVEELLYALPDLPPAPPAMPKAASTTPAVRWWAADGQQRNSSALPSPVQFVALMGQPAVLPAVQPFSQPVSLPFKPAGAVFGSGVTDKGCVRSRNEDTFVERGDIGLWAVADGAGGQGAGDVASSAVADALKALPAELPAGQVLAQVRLRLAEVHAHLQQLASQGDGKVEPATTVVVLLVNGDHFACLWAGDSRAYLFRAGVLAQVTRDHSLVQELVDAGTLSPEQAESHSQNNVITRAVGGSEDLQLDKVAGRLQPGDRVLLCTDGLFKALPEPVITQVLMAGGGPNELLARSLAAGARDNVTALLVTAA